MSHLRLVVAGVLVLVTLSRVASGQTNLAWDTNGATAGTGGTGTWETTTAVWFNGTTFVPWTNGTFDNAIFDGTAGTVTPGGAAPTISGAGTINSVLAGTAGITTGGGNVTLTLSGANTFTGPLTIGHGIPLLSSSTGSVILAPTASLTTSAVTIGSAPSANIIAVLQNQGNNRLTNATVSFNGVTNGWAIWQLLGTNQSVVGIDDSSAAGIIENTQSQIGIGNSTLTLTGAGTYSFNGFIRDTSSGSGTLALVKNGTGTQTLSGGGINYTGATTVNGGTLTLSNATAYRSATTVNSGASLTLAGSSNLEHAAGFSLTGNGAVTQTINSIIAGSAGVTKAGALGAPARRLEASRHAQAGIQTIGQFSPGICRTRDCCVRGGGNESEAGSGRA